MVGPKNIIEEVRKIHDFLTVSASSPLQEAAITGINFDTDYYKKLQETYTEKRDYFLNSLNKLGFTHTVPQGTYFILINIDEFGYDSDIEFCEMLVKDYKIAAVPGSCFFYDKNNSWIRLHFAKNRETLDEVIRRLEKLRRDFNI